VQSGLGLGLGLGSGLVVVASSRVDSTLIPPPENLWVPQHASPVPLLTLSDLERVRAWQVGRVRDDGSTDEHGNFGIKRAKERKGYTRHNQ